MTDREARSKKSALSMDARARNASRAILAVILVMLALWVARDFLASVGWAAVIAVTAWPLYVQFAKCLGRPSGSIVPPLVFTLLVALVLFLPVGLAAHRASQDIQAVSLSVTHYRQHGIPMPEWLPNIPVIGTPVAQWWKSNLSDSRVITEWIGAPDVKNEAAMTRALGVEFLYRFFHFMVVLIALFGFLKNGAWIANRILDTADRLLGDPGERLASRMVDTIRGTVNGTILIALAEGALIGVIYFVAGVPHALLFTLLTMAFAMIPFGAWAVFTSASILLLLQGGSAVAAASVFAVGAAVMIIGDLFVWAALVGGAARLPFLLALIGIFGGLQTFGLIGLFLGPVILAALLTVWKEWLMPRPS
jgi:predicted PurR-regulated permease PerM